MGTSIWQSVSQAVARLTGHGRKAKKEMFVNKGFGASTSDETLSTATKIVEVLMRAVADKAEVRVSLGGSVLEYKTRLLPERETRPDQGGMFSSEYLRDGAYLLIGPTIPPEGNEKIKAGRIATLTFMQDGKVIEFKSRFVDEHALRGMTALGGKRKTVAGSPSSLRSVPKKRPLHGVSPATAAQGKRVDAEDEDPYGVEGGVAQPLTMAFPAEIVRKALRRDAVRVEYSDATGVTLRIRSEGGADFDATILDISMGGCSFVLPYDVAFLSNGTMLELTFSWGEEEQVVQHGIFSKAQTPQGKAVGHVVFSAKTYESIQAVGALVTHIERVRLRVRHNLPPNATEGLAELYRLTPSSSAQELGARANRIRTV
ncbi:MAG: PilZ domain-containing protein [Magnetococcales bacterium]|nr:PilZ domain-containing protein [Magnetococcales bacterium]